MKVYVQRPDHFFYYIVKMTADYCNFPVETVIVDATMAEDKDFKAKKGTGNFPFAELADGSIIRESTAIAAHIARSAGKTDFIGGTPFEAAQISQVVDYTSADVSPAMVKVAYHTFGFTNDKAVYMKAVADLKGSAKLLNERVKGKSWLVGDRLTLADVVVFCNLLLPFAFVLDGGFRKAMPDVTAWFEKMSKLPFVARSAGYVKMHGAGAAAAPAKGGKDAAKGGDKKAKGGDKKAKGGKKEEPKKEEPAAAAEEDDFDDLFDGPADEDEAAKAYEELKKKAMAAKLAKPVPIARSFILWDVKGYDDQADLDALAAKIFKEITMDGLVWKQEYKKEPIAFGVKKLVIGAVVEDEKVSADGICESIEAFEDIVQSCDIAVFNKL